MGHRYYRKEYAYKLLEVERCNKTNQVKLHVQVCLKNIFLVFKPEELVSNENVLCCFSPLDVKQITTIALQEATQEESSKVQRVPQYKIIFHYYSKKDKKEMIVLSYKGKDERIIKSAQEISRDKNILTELDAVDANRIGYAAGYEQGLNSEVENTK